MRANAPSPQTPLYEHAAPGRRQRYAHHGEQLPAGEEERRRVAAAADIDHDRCHGREGVLYREIAACDHQGGMCQSRAFVRILRPAPPADPVVFSETAMGKQLLVD